MNKKRIYADPQKTAGRGRLALTCRGTKNDLERYGLELVEGLTVAFWMDDADERGNLDPLHFEGVVHFDATAGYWVAEVREDSYRNASRQEAYERYMKSHQGRPEKPFYLFIRSNPNY
jgi:hypothetical protein